MGLSQDISVMVNWHVGGRGVRERKCRNVSAMSMSR